MNYESPIEVSGRPRDKGQKDFRSTPEGRRSRPWTSPLKICRDQADWWFPGFGRWDKISRLSVLTLKYRILRHPLDPALGAAVICVAAIGVEGAATFSFDVCDARLLHSTRTSDFAILVCAD